VRRKTTKAYKSMMAETPDQVGRMLGLTPGDIMLMKYKAELSHLAVKAIRESGLKLSDIVKRSGAAGVELQPNAA
jgi:hypothetical protein